MNSKARFWVVVSFVVVLAAGVAGGLLLGRAWRFGDRPSRTDRPGPPSLEQMAKELDMTPAQKEDIRKIFERNEERLKELHSQVRLRFGDIRQRLKAEIDEVLSLEQRSKLDALLERHMKKERDARRRYPNRTSQSPDGPKGEHP